jgi:hypothetical protein
MGFFPKQPASRQGVTQSLAIGGASATLPNPFGSETYQVRLAATVPCFYLITENANPVAASATNAAFLPANWVEHVIVSPGEKLTVIEATGTGGTLSVTEVS